MKNIFDAIKCRFHANWLTLLIGWRGVGNRPKGITLQDVRGFAAEMLGRSEGVDPRVSELAMMPDADESHVDSILSGLVAEGRYEYDTELRKWMVGMLEQELTSLPSDPLYGLLQLTDFWSQFGFPTDSPHEVQGKDNNITPTEYYTKETYDRLRDQHKTWLAHEIELLKRAK